MCPASTKPKLEKEVPVRSDTRYNDIKHLYEFSDISTAAPTRFPDMGYLLFGYDLYKRELFFGIHEKLTSCPQRYFYLLKTGNW